MIQQSMSVSAQRREGGMETHREQAALMHPSYWGQRTTVCMFKCIYAYSSAHTHGCIFYVCDCAGVCVCVYQASLQELKRQAWASGCWRGRHRLSGTVETLVCLHWWEEGWASLLHGTEELLWLGATEGDGPGG